ncbi:MAG: hypothetical protein K9N10_04155 [Deltaproteobacteria bacterium]|nr:hypothetical protein [Deltaproteobacteria bacterium]
MMLWRVMAFIFLFVLWGPLWTFNTASAAEYTTRNNWMKDLDDDLPITEITIPGTHDSAADYNHCYENSACRGVIEFVHTQTNNIQHQMEAGIRFFDVRLAYNSDNITYEFHHGPYDLKQSIEDAIGWAQDFLAENPSEFLIWLVKQEHSDADADAFWSELSLMFQGYPDLFFLERRIISVWEARGRVIVMARNYSSLYPQGFHVSWGNNTRYDQESDGELTYVAEDHYSLNTVTNETKFMDVRRNLYLARSCTGCGTPNTLFFTFLSGEADASLTGPYFFAAYQNPHTYDYLTGAAPGGPRTGIVAMDFAGDNKYAGDDLIGALVGQNLSHPVPGWFGGENDGGGITAADINGNNKPDLVVFSIDNPSGANGGYYRIGWDVDENGKTGNWTGPQGIPWQGDDQQGGGITAADVNGDGTPDLIVFMIDDPAGENTGYYRVGIMDSTGVATKWTDFYTIPGWFGGENDGGGITAADINGNNKQGVVVFSIDNPSGVNGGYYRIGWDVDKNGKTGNWTGPQGIPWQGDDQQGGGITATDVNGDTIPDLILFMIDNPSGVNYGYYRVGLMDRTGTVTKWHDFERTPLWFKDQQFGGITVFDDFNGEHNPKMLLFFINDPAGENYGYYQVKELSE